MHLSCCALQRCFPMVAPEGSSCGQLQERVLAVQDCKHLSLLHSSEVQHPLTCACLCVIRTSDSSSADRWSATQKDASKSKKAASLKGACTSFLSTVLSHLCQLNRPSTAVIAAIVDPPQDCLSMSSTPSFGSSHAYRKRRFAYD